MAFKQDPQGRSWVAKVTKVLELLIPTPDSFGKFITIFEEVWQKIENKILSVEQDSNELFENLTGYENYKGKITHNDDQVSANTIVINAVAGDSDINKIFYIKSGTQFDKAVKVEIDSLKKIVENVESNKNTVSNLVAVTNAQQQQIENSNVLENENKFWLDKSKKIVMFNVRVTLDKNTPCSWASDLYFNQDTLPFTVSKIINLSVQGGDPTKNSETWQFPKIVNSCGINGNKVSVYHDGEGIVGSDKIAFVSCVAILV